MVMPVSEFPVEHDPSAPLSPVERKPRGCDTASCRVMQAMDERLVEPMTRSESAWLVTPLQSLTTVM